MNRFQLSFATIEELRGLLDSRGISARELAMHFLERLERFGPTYNALAALTRDRALAEADQADRALARGGTAPLLGIPYGAKDLLAARGAPTIWGSAAYAGQTFDYDAAAIERLHRAGAVLAAKLALMELAGFHGGVHASVHGPGRNPWDIDRWACGSSSGSGAAVAAGLVPFALGSETGGSIGSPSAFCGITGLRPTFGLVSRYGAMPLAWSLDKIGPMGRSATDCAIVLEQIAGYDRRDEDSSRRGFRRSQVEAITKARTRPWRLAMSTFDVDEGADPPIRGAVRQAIRAFEDLGVEFHEAELPPGLPYLDLILAVVNGEGTTAFASLIESDRLGLLADQEQQAKLRQASTTTARTYVQAMRDRRLVRDGFAEIFRDADAILTYTLPWEPHRIDAVFEPVHPTRGFTGMVAASNLAGLPAVFLPAGLSDNGLPVGIQLVGPPFSEATLVAIGETFQRATDFHRLQPPLPEAMLQPA